MTTGKAINTRWHRRHRLAMKIRGGKIHGWRYRLADLVMLRFDDWPSALMVLTGSDFGGNWSEPEPPTWWYRAKSIHRRRITNYPFRKFIVVKDYSTFCSMTTGLNEDQMDEWQAIGVDQDGELILGHIYWGGRFHSLPVGEWHILLRWLLRWQFTNWFGLRTRIYEIGLYNKVHRRRRGRCNVVPPRGPGGYDHWHCTKRKGHDGGHRFQSYVWDDSSPRVTMVER